jgi:hypothetical protein
MTGEQASRIKAEAIKKAVKEYRCQYTINDLDNGMPLVDMLTPPGDKDIVRGQLEVELLIDSIAGECSYALAQAISDRRE